MNWQEKGAAFVCEMHFPFGASFVFGKSKTQSEPLRNHLSSCKGLIEIICHVITNPLNILWKQTKKNIKDSALAFYMTLAKTMLYYYHTTTTAWTVNFVHICKNFNYWSCAFFHRCDTLQCEKDIQLFLRQDIYLTL